MILAASSFLFGQREKFLAFFFDSLDFFCFFFHQGKKEKA